MGLIFLRFFFIFFHTLLNFFLSGILGIVKLANAIADAAHQLRNFFTAEQKQNGQKDENPFAAAGHADKEKMIKHED